MNTIHCPILKDLPIPPENKAGWPWTEEIEILPEKMNSGSPWPRISIITPSYNQGQYLEETIRSVILQGYPNLEFILIDGGSTDNSVDIIRKYEKWISYWISEPDKGQSDAINKGLRLSKADYINWINSDDMLAKGALEKIAALIEQTPNDTIIAGDVFNFYSCSFSGQLIHQKGITLRSVIHFWDRSCVWHQPGLFFPMTALKKISFINESLHYVMDYDLLCRLLSFCKVAYLDHTVAHFRLHEDSKGVSKPEKTTSEHIMVARRYWNLTGWPIWLNELRLRLWLLIALASALKRRNYAAVRVSFCSLFK